MTRRRVSMTILVGAVLVGAVLVGAVLVGAVLVGVGAHHSSLDPAGKVESALAPATSAPDAAAQRAGADSSWWQAVSTDLARQEYAVTPGPAGLQAPNRAQNVRTLFKERGIEVIPRTGKDAAPAWRYVWQTSGIGRPGQMQAAAAVPPTSNGNRVTYRREGWSEWYENTAKGLEQGFSIDRRPAGAGPLQIASAFPPALRAQLRADGAVDFIDRHGVCAIRYGELHVYDARGTEVSAKLVVAAAELAIVVEDRDAAYPLTIDPVLTSPAWLAEGNQSSAWFGYRVATAGDVNKDGFSDVIVGAPLFDNGQADEGRAFVYLGSAGGLSFTPNWTAESDQAGAFFGGWVATAGDVNGDGFGDVIITAPLFDNGQTDEGRAFVYHGSASGLSLTANWTAESDQANAQLYSAATAGDVNGDGFSDVILGASLYDNGQTDEGRALVYQGSAAGLSPTASWSAEINQADAQFGQTVSTAGDVNGDGYSDVIVGAIFYDHGQIDEGGAFVYHGSASGLATTPAWTGEGNQAGAYYSQVSTAGDDNGDGYADVIVGAYRYDAGQSDEGAAFVYHGSASGLAATPAWTTEGNQVNAYFGSAVATAGDVNGDGYSDVIVGALYFDNGQTDEGRAYVYQGSAVGLGAAPVWITESNQADARLGDWVATAGDVNGDGYSDVIVGAFLFDNGLADQGRAFVFQGSAAGLANTSGWTAESDQMGALFGLSVATAGDVNGDGYSDVIVGAPHFDNGQSEEGRAFVYHGSATGLAASAAWTAESDKDLAEFGISVATAGDVNGDGFSDVIVGAEGFTNGETNEGRAYVYLGSPVGLSLSPAWIAESNSFSAIFGAAVATAGDVNGDGFSDVIVGAPRFRNGGLEVGRAFVFCGSASGLATTAAWTAEGNQSGESFGNSVASAGDVNGDGFSDVIIGAGSFSHGEASEGRALVFHGSAAGLANVPAWTAEGDQNDAHFGRSVATAGDVNGDGFSDVIVGAPDLDVAQTNEGRAYVYQGSTAGLAASPAWTTAGGQLEASYGMSVATAGDVNGDGYSDVIVGAYRYDGSLFVDSGMAFVYYGSASGLGSSPWTAGNLQPNAAFGISVGTAGDVNGDGFSDVIVGAYQHDNGQTDEGRGFLFFGNDGGGPSRVARQARTNDFTPVSLLCSSDSESGFRLKAIGRTASGRGRVQMQYEVKPFGVPFNGSGIVNGASLDTGTPAVGGGSGVALSELASGLASGSLYHWRMRIRSNSPFFPSTPWLMPTGNNVTEADIRTHASTTGVEGTPELSDATLQIPSAQPNPFAGSTDIRYALPVSGRVRLAVFDVNGRECALLVDGPQASGSHHVSWDGRRSDGQRVPTGVYFARIATNGHTRSRKLILVQ